MISFVLIESSWVAIGQIEMKLGWIEATYVEYTIYNSFDSIWRL